MELPSLLNVIPLYTAILGIIFIVITARCGLYRAKSGVSMGDGGDDELLRRMRSQANFIESVPIALVLLVSMELSGASDTWLHSLGAALVVGRILHYLGLSGIGPGMLRPPGMILTLLPILISSIWLLAGLL
ncbi:MAG: putative membrane protein YecN with MAPEG domain [Halieaceae bacterium]|jgi:uncharacterized membrane protein YecN with MAPEG domain